MNSTVLCVVHYVGKHVDVEDGGIENDVRVRDRPTQPVPARASVKFVGRTAGRGKGQRSHISMMMAIQ